MARRRPDPVEANWGRNASLLEGRPGPNLARAAGCVPDIIQTLNGSSNESNKAVQVVDYLAPRGGFEMDEKTPRILGIFDLSSLEIPPKTPLLNGGCCQILLDVVGRQFVSIGLQGVEGV